MELDYSPDQLTFGLLPEPQRSVRSFIASMGINVVILAALLAIGAMAKQVIVERKYEDTTLVYPAAPPPRPRITLPEPPKIKPPAAKYERPKIHLPAPELKPEPRPIQMESKVDLPVIKAVKPAVVLAPQPKPAMAAAMPAQSVSMKPSTALVHLGDAFGVAPNPNANRPASVTALGNPYGGTQGSATAPHGVVGSTGIGNGLKSGSSGGAAGRVAAVGFPAAVYAAAPMQAIDAAPASTNLEIISKPPVRYTSEARQLRIEGDVVFRVTFAASGQVVVQSLVRGLGHGLDEEARRVAQMVRFRPATRNGQPIDVMTNITITFQLA